MALSGTLVWEVRTTGNSANGGAFRGTALAGTPSTPTVTPSSTGGTIAAGTYYCVITYAPGGETRESPISAETSATLTGTTSSLVVTHPTDPGNNATWNLYVGTTSGGPYFPQGTALAIGSNRSVTTTPPTTGTQPPGVDYSQQDSPQVTYSDLVIGATNTTATSATTPFTPAMVGNLLNVTGGTGFTAQRCEITGVTAAGVATFDKALGTASSTGGTGRLGGAVDHPATINSILTVAGMIVFNKYSVTSYVFTSGLTSNSAVVSWVGYDTTRTINNTDANRPIWRMGANSITLYSTNQSQRHVNIDFDNPSAFTGVTGMWSNGQIIRCRFSDINTVALLLNSTGAYAEQCEFVRCSGTNSLYINQSGIAALRCLFRSCTTSIRCNGDGILIYDCVVYNQSSVSAFTALGSTVFYLNTLVHTTTTNTFDAGAGAGNFVLYDQCVVWGTATNFFAYGCGFSARNGARSVNCRAGGSGLDFQAGRFASDQVTGFVHLTGDPCVNAAALDFSPNSTAGAGALCRGLTVALPGGTTTSYPDAGAAQHSDSSVSSGPTYSSY